MAEMLACATCPLCSKDEHDCKCNPETPGFYHPDPDIDAEARADGCVWCLAGEPRVPSSVSPRFVHMRTTVGRALCASMRGVL